MRKLLFPLMLCPVLTMAQSPEITSWILNTSGQTGYGGIPTNIQQVQYSANNVYVTATCIPDYTIGPWTNNPNTPVNQNFVFKITRNPVQNNGVLTATPMGHTGVWTNGVSIFNAKDGISFNNLGIWNRDALVFEGISFDNCLGHPAPNGEYHHHVNPTCLYDDTDNTVHAPVIGFAFDGFPIYGAYGYDQPNGTGIFRKMNSSYQLRNITSRTSLPDGTLLNASQYGPAIGGQYPLGAFLEDYEYVPGSGDLDEHNGRFCVTPEYPAGIYAYFVTIDANENPVYPYTIGPTYYGTVQSGNTGPNSGHNVVNEPVVTYVPGSTGMAATEQSPFHVVVTNNGSGTCAFSVTNNYSGNLSATLYDVTGKKTAILQNIRVGISYPIKHLNPSSGLYVLEISAGNEWFRTRIVY